MKQRLKFTGRFTFPLAAALALLAAIPGRPPAVQAAEEAASAPGKQSLLSNEEEKAWAEIQEAAKPPSSPAEWRTQRPSTAEIEKFRSEQAGPAALAADKVKEFLTRFPKSTHLAAARKLHVQTLRTAFQFGKKERQAELIQVLSELAGDASLPDNDRVDYRLQQFSFERPATGSNALERRTDMLFDLQKEFPKSERVYALLLGIAMNDVASDNAAKIARLIVAAAAAPAKAKQKAQDILDGKIFSAAKAVGKPVDIKFTAVDGREVDLSKLKGKVVLVDFWATWCGPCVAEIPNVKAAYEKYHDQGFEIVGISFDREGDKEKLIKFTKDKGMPWPQYFDGKFWENEFGQQFNIRAIPAMWLFDKQGNLADPEGRRDLADKVAKLLAAS